MGQGGGGKGGLPRRVAGSFGLLTVILPLTAAKAISMTFLNPCPSNSGLFGVRSVRANTISAFRFMEEFQWFLMALSVRPGITFAISAHLLPSFWCWIRIVWS